MDMVGDGMMMGPMMVIVMLIVAILVLAALIGGTVWLVRTLGEDRRSRDGSAIDTLEMRYARGEIDRDGYVQRRDDLHRRA